MESTQIQSEDKPAVRMASLPMCALLQLLELQGRCWLWGEGSSRPVALLQEHCQELPGGTLSRVRSLVLGTWQTVTVLQDTLPYGASNGQDLVRLLGINCDFNSCVIILCLLFCKQVLEDNPSHSDWDSEPEGLSDFSCLSFVESGTDSQPDGRTQKPFPISKASQSGKNENQTTQNFKADNVP